MNFFGSTKTSCSLSPNFPGFRGRYLIYDLPPMLLLQRFWLRRAGVPAVLGANFARSERRTKAVDEAEEVESSFGRGLGKGLSLFCGALVLLFERGLASLSLYGLKKIATQRQLGTFWIMMDQEKHIEGLLKTII